MIEQAKVLVTGGSSGIGLATARLFASRGAKVAICGRNPGKLYEAAADAGVTAIEADVSREPDVKRLVATVIEALGGYDVLINNAGYGVFAPLVDTSLEDMKRLYDTNVFGAMLVGRESARHFIEQERGTIVNVASTAGQRGFFGGTAYASSKFALSGMTECWRAELRKHNIRVTQINPSEVQTDFFTTAGGEGRPFNPRKLTAGDIAQAIVSVVELNERGFVPEISVWATNPG